MKTLNLYQITLALVLLYFVMEHVPYGSEIGYMILLLALLETPDALNYFNNFLCFVQGKTFSGGTCN